MKKIFSAPSIEVSKMSAANILTTSGMQGQLGTMTHESASSNVWGNNAAARTDYANPNFRN